ncbi:DUF443 family protein [Enterococcus sp. BWR-S5]|uniref:DUF443 family protein n=1 Tax=Enterococcus sp. BWR-S5 TaxID=2787714 RepID=UPI0019231394|nr:DUF443 family protein [Enterococcus sp. BWR-S5]MBL1225303.1 DUF443 family protein [Enterococcus sp. BWR-S5]
MEITKTENKRYKQLTYNGKSYLLDMDSNKLTWFFPFLVWFFPIKGYQDATLPLEKTEKPKKGGGLILLSSVLSGIMIRMTNRGFGDLSVYENYQQFFLLLLSSLTGAVFLVRYIYRYKKSQIPLGEKIFYIKIRFEKGIIGKVIYGYKLLVLTFLSYVILVFLIYTFFDSYPNIIVVFPILLVEYFILIINTTILPPEKDYAIEISQKK